MTNNFKFKMNNRTWEIIEVPQKALCDEFNEEVSTSKIYFGLCKFSQQIIMLEETLCPEQKEKTLLHELMHCYISSFIAFGIGQVDEDTICDISANSHNIIHKIANDYYNWKYEQNKKEGI